MSAKASILDIIKKRKSIRAYENIPIDKGIIKKIEDYISEEKNLTGPHGQSITLYFVPVQENITDKGIKIGTYGFIKNPKGYIAGICKNEKEFLIDYGYSLEKLILYLTEINIGTCWLGGTFTRESFYKELTMEKGEFIPAITPIGYAREKQGLLQTAIRFAAKSDDRKPWSELFFNDCYDTPMTKAEAGKLEIPLEMVRLAPSASNKQPWRIVMSKDKQLCHFYREKDPKYIGNKLGYDIQLLDMGIAMCHFELSCKELSINGEWLQIEESINNKDRSFEYITSWKLL